MRCPRCNCENDKVIDSRTILDGSGVRRRRECTGCGARFSTLETVIPEELKVVKRDGRREEFCREKLYGGLRNACYKRLTVDQIDEVCDGVTQSLLKDFEREVESSVIGERVMAALRKLDQVAYVRFASVYRQFQDAKDFISEVKGLKR